MKKGIEHYYYIYGLLDGVLVSIIVALATMSLYHLIK